jgi:hypothetical protein
MLEDLQRTKDVKLDYKFLYREKMINQKLRLKDQMLTNNHIRYQGKVAKAISSERNNFEE